MFSNKLDSEFFEIAVVESLDLRQISFSFREMALLSDARIDLRELSWPSWGAGQFLGFEGVNTFLGMQDFCSYINLKQIQLIKKNSCPGVKPDNSASAKR